MIHTIIHNQRHEPPTGQQYELLQEALQTAIIQHASMIKVIRKNARPVMIEDTSLENNPSITGLSDIYNIPAYIIAEILSNAQMIGFLDGTIIKVSNETIESHSDKTERDLINLFVEPYRVDTPHEVSLQDISAIHTFLVALGQTSLIHMLQDKNIDRKHMPRGVIRQISLFDMDYKNTFSSLTEWLDFIMLNIKEQDRLFHNDYAIMLQENGGLPVDDIIGKETTMLSKESYFGRISTIQYKDQKIDALMRIIPGFSPVGLDVMVGLDLPGGNQNYFATIGIQFNIHNEEVVPVVHTLQLSTHNIGSTPEGDLVGIKEPYDTNTVSMKERMRIINAFADSIYDIKGLRIELENIVEAGISTDMIQYLDNNAIKALQGKHTVVNGGIRLQGTPQERRKIKDTVIQGVIESLKNDAIMPILASTVSYLFAHGYPCVIIQNPTKNLRLQQHNQQRSEESIASSGMNLYNKKAIQLGGVKDNDGNFIITPEGFINAHAIPYNGLQHINVAGLLQAKNNIFEENHPAQITSFDIQTKTDHALLDIFIQSHYYNAC